MDAQVRDGIDYKEEREEGEAQREREVCWRKRGRGREREGKGRGNGGTREFHFFEVSPLFLPPFFPFCSRRRISESLSSMTGKKEEDAQPHRSFCPDVAPLPPPATRSEREREREKTKRVSERNRTLK